MMKRSKEGFTNLHQNFILFSDEILEKSLSLRIYVGKVYQTEPHSKMVPTDEYIAIYVGKSEPLVAGEYQTLKYPVSAA